MLTKKQWVMFSFFITVLAITFLQFAYTKNTSVILENLTLLLFLASLYLSNSFYSKQVTLLSGIVLIVTKAYSLIKNYELIFTEFGLIQIILLIALFLFISKIYKNNLRTREINLTIVLLSLIFVIYILNRFIPLLSLIKEFNMENIIYIGNYLVILSLPLAMITYLLIHRKRL